MKILRKRLTSFITSITVIFTMLSFMPSMQIINVSAATNEQIIYDYLIKLGYNKAAACGILANIEEESGYISNKNEKGGGGYGLCQWTGSRKTKLINYCRKNGLNYTTIAGQLEYLKHELSSDFPLVSNVLKSIDNNEDGAYKAAYEWCMNFEKPEYRNKVHGQYAANGKPKVNGGFDYFKAYKTVYSCSTARIGLTESQYRGKKARIKYQTISGSNKKNKPVLVNTENATYVVTVDKTSNLNIRKEADVNSDIVKKLKNGTKVKVTKKYQTDDPNYKYWLYLPDYQGYAYEGFLKKEKSNESQNSKPKYSTAVKSGLYYIVPKCAPKSRLDVSKGEKANGTNVQIWESDDSVPQQRFVVVKSNDGYYTFIDYNSIKAVDVKGGEAKSGTNVQIYEKNGSDAQKWRLYDAGDGYYYIQSKLDSSLYLDVSGRKSANGTNVKIYKSNNLDGQKFKFEVVKQETGVVPDYKQYDERWAKYEYTKGETLKSSGCIVTSLAMAYSYNSKKTVYPNQMKKLEFDKNGNIKWNSVNNYGFSEKSYENVKIDQKILKFIFDKLKENKPVVIYCQGHAVCITGYKGTATTFTPSNFTVNDPGYKATNLQQHLNKFPKIRHLVY